jgi:Caspase domain
VTESLRRALLVGINNYDNFSPLGGCISDVNALEPLLAKHEDGSRNFDCATRYTASRDSLVGDVDALLSPGADLALLYFAGHGMSHTNDVSLCTMDGTPNNPGLRFSQIGAMLRESKVGEVIVVLDCCFSGAAGGVPQFGGENALMRHGVTILAASRGDQASAEHADRGVFSFFFGAALDGGAADVLGKVTVAGVYAYLSELFGAWDQRPTFKANLDKLHELRLCHPAVPLEKLRRLTDFFPDFDDEYDLDPSYEPTEDPRNEEHEAIFSILQQCRAAKLVEPVGHEHMYYVAIQSLSCRLTPLGQHYWRLVKRGRL